MRPALHQVTKHRVVRVGFAPEPWAWADWGYARDGHRFDGRFDDPEGRYRIAYAGDSLRGCLLELLAQFRPESVLSQDIASITDNDPNGSATVAPGTVPRDFAEKRCMATARLTGRFCEVTHSRTAAWLQHRFSRQVDTAILKDAQERTFTQAVSRAVYEEDSSIGGLEYRSRWGDEETLWAIYERPVGHGGGATQLQHQRVMPLLRSHPDVVEVFALFNLQWADVETGLVPFTVHDADEVFLSAFPQTGGVPTDQSPFGAVLVWAGALTAGDTSTLWRVTLHPLFWDEQDYVAARAVLKTPLGFRSRPEFIRDGLPAGVAEVGYVFYGMGELGSTGRHAVQFFDDYEHHGGPSAWFTVVRPEGKSCWRVGGVGINCVIAPQVLAQPGPRVALGVLGHLSGGV